MDCPFLEHLSSVFLSLVNIHTIQHEIVSNMVWMFTQLSSFSLSLSVFQDFSVMSEQLFMTHLIRARCNHEQIVATCIIVESIPDNGINSVSREGLSLGRQRMAVFEVPQATSLITQPSWLDIAMENN